MRTTLIPLFVLLTLAAAAAAQDPEARYGEDRGGERRGHGPPIGRLVEMLDERLNFDADQAAQIDEIVAAHEERMQEFRVQRRAMRDAMESGDEETAAELREQFRAQRELHGRGPRGILDEIEPLLHEGQLEAFQQFREEIAQRGAHGGRGRMRQMFRDLPHAVNMTEDQRREFEEILSKQRETMRERMRERFQQTQEGGFEWTDRPTPPDFSAMYDDLFDQVAEILGEDQLELLARYEAEVGLAMRAPETQKGDDLLVTVAAANRLRDLSSEQKESWRIIKRKAMQDSKELRRGDKKEKAALAAEVRTEILKILDEEQKAEFERIVKRLESRQKGTRHRRPLGQGERPTEPAAHERD